MKSKLTSYMKSLLRLLMCEKNFRKLKVTMLIAELA